MAASRGSAPIRSPRSSSAPSSVGGRNNARAPASAALWPPQGTEALAAPGVVVRDAAARTCPVAGTRSRSAQLFRARCRQGCLARDRFRGRRAPPLASAASPEDRPYRRGALPGGRGEAAVQACPLRFARPAPGSAPPPCFARGRKNRDHSAPFFLPRARSAWPAFARGFGGYIDSPPKLRSSEGGGRWRAERSEARRRGHRRSHSHLPRRCPRCDRRPSGCLSGPGFHSLSRSVAEDAPSQAAIHSIEHARSAGAGHAAGRAPALRERRCRLRRMDP